MNEITVKEATHANQYLHSDVYPFEIIEKRTPRKILIRMMDAELDPNFKCDFEPGGFAGHCKNLHEQRYTYSSNEGYVIKAIRLDKKGVWKDKYGNKFNLALKPRKFYNYNF